MALTIDVHTEFEMVDFTKPAELLVMVSLSCPDVTCLLSQQQDAEQQSRAPVAICCVLDKSGSMSGRKLELLKTATLFVVDQLTMMDTLTIVAFDTEVNVDFPTRNMDVEGKALARNAIRKLASGSSTNLSGGLFEGLDQLKRLDTHAAQPKQEQQQQPQSSKVMSLLLFTDGLANHGLSKSDEITKSMASILEGMPPCGVYTFGFGDDHSSEMLQAISTAGNGMYYFVQKEDEIPQSFSDCLGGLLTIAVQNFKVVLRVPAAEGYVFKECLSEFKQTEIESGKAIELRLGDLYVEERKDLLFRVAVPALAGPAENDVVATASISYLNAIEKDFKNEERTFVVHRRPEEYIEPFKCNVTLDRQRNRIRCAEALRNVTQLCEANNVTEARAVLQRTSEIIRTSPSGNDTFCVALLADLQSAERRLEHEGYTSHAGHHMRNACHGHMKQRCTTTSYATDAYAGQQMYETSSKVAMKMAFH